MRSIYLDHAAATPLNKEVFLAMRPYFSDQFYNPSATYLAAQSVHSDIETARSSVASTIGSRPAEIIFTAGGSEANNLAIHGVMRRYPGKKVITSSIEHESVLSPAHEYNSYAAPVNPDGFVDTVALKRAIDDNTVLVSIMYANNEVGTIQPLHDIATLIAEIRSDRRERSVQTPLFFHTDAAQASNYLDLHVSRLGVDLMTLNAGKIYGPKQTGSLYIRSTIQLSPLIYGGGQEHNLRSGTENVAGIMGYSRALRIAQSSRQAESRRLEVLQRQFFDRIAGKIPNARINGARQKRLVNNIHLTIPGYDNERLIMQLDAAGILAAAGSACSASSDEPSHVLLAMGLTKQAAQSSLRLTMGRSTTERDVQMTVDTLARCIA